MFSYLTSTVISIILFLAFTLTHQLPMNIELVLLAMAALGALIFGTAACMLLSDNMPTLDILRERIVLSPLRAIEGRPTVFVATGMSASGRSLVYNYCVKREDGCLLHGSLNIGGVTVIEDPSLTEVGQLSVFVRRPDPSSRRRRWTNAWFATEFLLYEFRVPVGTVIWPWGSLPLLPTV